MTYKGLEELVFCSYKMKLRLRDIESDIADMNDLLDMIQRSIEVMGDNVDDDELLQWIWSVHLDDQERNRNPCVISQAREEGVDVDTLLSEDVSQGSHEWSDDERGPNDGDDDKDVVILAGILLVKMLLMVVVEANLAIRGLWSKAIKSQKIQITGHVVKDLTS